jgi:hypothetical protein
LLECLTPVDAQSGSVRSLSCCQRSLRTRWHSADEQ